MRLLLLSCWVSLVLSANAAIAEEPSSNALRQRVTLRPDVVLVLRTAPFHPTNHRIEQCRIKGSTLKKVCLIDGKPVFGTDGELPKNTLEDAQLEWAGTTVHLDVSAMFDPWIEQATIGNFAVEDVEGGNLSLRGCFSDAAGSYVVEWLLIRGVPLRTILSNDETVMFSFACNRPGRQSNSRLHRTAAAGDASRADKVESGNQTAAAEPPAR